MDRRRAGNIAGVAFAVLLVLGFGLSRVVGDIGSGPVSTCDDPIDWRDASEVSGDRAAISGQVAAASYEPDVGGAPTFLNLGNAHPDPDRFDVVIYDDVRAGFEQAPEQMLDGEQICVQGRIRDREGVPQIILDSPDFIVTR